MTGPLSLPDVLVIVAYIAGVVTLGMVLGRGQRDSSDYFLGRNTLPWWAICFSIVATETSALTVISVPGIAARGDFTFLQLAFGYLIGRLLVAWWLLPGYFEGSQETAYVRLGTRFGPGPRRVASGLFSVTRALGDGVRVFATAIPLTIITGWSIPLSIVAVGLVAFAYTLVGGLRSVVWVDVVQLAIYVVGGAATIVVANSLAGGFDAMVTAAGAEGKLRLFDWSWDWTTTYTVAGGLIGGAFLSAASHGTDHLMVQRLLAAPSLRAARMALVGSGGLVILQFALFLGVGTALWAAGADRASLGSDELYATFVVEALPRGLAGLVVASILAAAMSTVSSSLNSLASGTTYDFYADLTGRSDPKHLLRVGRGATVGWALVLMGGAYVFSRQGRDASVVETALSIASLTYGPLLGTFILAGWRRAQSRDAIVAIVVTVAVMSTVALGFPIRLLPNLAWPWYVPLGTLLCIGVGTLSQGVGTLSQLAFSSFRSSSDA